MIRYQRVSTTGWNRPGYIDVCFKCRQANKFDEPTDIIYYINDDKCSVRYFWNWGRNGWMMIEVSPWETTYNWYHRRECQKL